MRGGPKQGAVGLGETARVGIHDSEDKTRLAGPVGPQRGEVCSVGGGGGLTRRVAYLGHVL